MVTVIVNDLQGHSAQKQRSWTALSMQWILQCDYSSVLQVPRGHTVALNRVTLPEQQTFEMGKRL